MAAFPLAYSVLLSALSFQSFVDVAGLIWRGVAFVASRRTQRPGRSGTRPSPGVPTSRRSRKASALGAFTMA